MEPPSADLLHRLELRLGRLHARQRLGVEADHEAQVFGQGLNFVELENWYSIHALIRAAFKLTGLYGRGLRNAADIQVRRTELFFPHLPAAFDGFTLLHLTDLHIDMSAVPMQRLLELLPGLDYDLCLMTGDYRGATYGPFDVALEGMARIRAAVRTPIYAVLGNHDTIRLVPTLEDLGIRMLLNECERMARGEDRIFLAGVDDPHFYRVDNLEKAAIDIPVDSFSVLLAHTPEIYRQAAHAGFDLMLCGHTHGGQVCLPGGIPLTLQAKMPRRYGAGLWHHHQMTGYTSVGAGSSVVPIRFNCRPEITLHTLRRGGASQRA